MFVDANIAIALLNVDDVHHTAAINRLSNEPGPRILSITWGESMIAAYASGSRQGTLAADLLNNAFERVDVDQRIVETAARLRGSLVRKGIAARRLPMLDALVVAAAVVHDDKLLTADTGWPVTELRVKQRVVLLA
jgi:predicted nucleic acid-binding protein